MSIRRMLNSVVRGMLIIITRIRVGSNSNGALGKEFSTDGSGAVQGYKTAFKDVYPESGFRLPLPKRDDLDDYGKKVYDKTVGSWQSHAGWLTRACRNPFAQPQTGRA